jgi:hypothetical protein
MNLKTYTYSILQYRHSQILEEVLNVGVIVYHHKEEKLFFLYPEKLARIRFAYPDVPEKIIKAYCKAFENRANEITQTPDFFSKFDLKNSFEKFLNDEFLSSDNSSLQFTNSKIGLSNELTYKIINNQLYNLYFTVFEHHGEIIKRIDEIYLINKYKQLLKKLDKEILDKKSSKLKFDYIIKPSEENEIKFDFAWQNNGLNLVKPISFDVKRRETLQRKAYLNFGQFSAIEDYAKNNKLRFDLILAKPKNKELYKSYDEAVSLLQKPKYVTLIDSNELEAYSKKTILELLK